MENETQETQTEKIENMSEKRIREANEAAERIEKANAKTEEMIARQEALAVEKMLGGKADAGTQKKEEPAEITPEEYAKMAIEGKLNK